LPVGAPGSHTGYPSASCRRSAANNRHELCPSYRALALIASGFAPLPTPARLIPTSRLLLIPTTAPCPFALHGASDARNDLPHGPLDIFAEHLGRLAPPLRCAISSRSVNSASPASVNPPCRNDVRANSSRRPAARITSLTLRLMWVRSISSSLGKDGHGACLPQSAAFSMAARSSVPLPWPSRSRRRPDRSSAPTSDQLFDDRDRFQEGNQCRLVGLTTYDRPRKRSKPFVTAAPRWLGIPPPPAPVPDHGRRVLTLQVPGNRSRRSARQKQPRLPA
jgi:hypothetical protein